MNTYKKYKKYNNFNNFNRASKISRSSINPNITYDDPLPIEVEENPYQYMNKEIIYNQILNYILNYYNE